MKLILKRLRKLEEERRQAEGLPFSIEVVFIDAETKQPTSSLLLKGCRPAAARKRAWYSR